MQLFILILVAGVVGYLLAKSRLSKPIDKTSEKVTETTRDLADKTEGWVRGRFNRKEEAEGEQDASVDEGVGEAVVVVEEKKTAKKRSSRRAKDVADESEEVETVEP